MRKYIVSTFIFFITFVIIFIFISTRKNNVTDLESAFIKKPTPQELKKRKWKDINLQKIGESKYFITSLHMRFSKKGGIFVADNNNKIIKEYDIEGNLVNSIGKGEGRGPGEFLIIVDILSDRLGRIWAIDDQNNRATIYEPKIDSITNIVDFPFVFGRVIPINESEYWAQLRFDHQIRKYNIYGEQIEEIEPITDDPPLWSFVLESYSALASDGSVIQSQYHTNMFLRYSKEGKLIYYRKPIEFLGLPNFDPYYANEVGKMNTVDFSTWKQITRNPQVVNNTIHLFIHQKIQGSDDWKQGFIDVYNLSNGDYMYSYQLPERLESIAISEGFIAGISEELGKLIVWKRD